MRQTGRDPRQEIDKGGLGSWIRKPTSTARAGMPAKMTHRATKRADILADFFHPLSAWSESMKFGGLTLTSQGGFVCWRTTQTHNPKTQHAIRPSKKSSLCVLSWAPGRLVGLAFGVLDEST